METKSEMRQCCNDDAMPRHKKVFLIFMGCMLMIVFAVAIAAIGIRMREFKNQNNISTGEIGYGQMMRDASSSIEVSSRTNVGDQFVLPQDAIKSGELSIMVSDIEAAKKSVGDIAMNNGGNIYATFISYASGNTRNGSIVVQVPDANFNKTFLSLRRIGNKVGYEKTTQIPKINSYAVPVAGVTQNSAVPETIPTSNGKIDTTKTISEPEIAMYPNPIYPQFNQDKAYIRVIFTDYGNKMNNNKNVIGLRSFSNQNMQNNPIVIFGIKAIFLVILIGLLLVIFARLLSYIRRKKEHSRRIHVVRLTPKTNRRVIKIAKRK